MIFWLSKFRQAPNVEVELQHKTSDGLLMWCVACMNAVLLALPLDVHCAWVVWHPAAMRCMHACTAHVLLLLVF
jgi:hypothetical protein